MLNTVRSSLKNSLIYGLGNIAVKVIGFLLIPLYTDPKYFTIDDFGIMGLLDISGLVLIAFMGSSLPQSLTRWYWDKDHLNNQKGIFFMTLVMQVGMSLLFCLLLMPFSRDFSQIILHKPDWTRAVNLLIISSALQAVNTIVNTLIRLQSKSVLYTIANLSKLVVVLSTTIYLIVVQKLGIDGIYMAQVIGNLFFIVILLGYTVRNSILSFNTGVVASMFSFGFPLLLANISGVALNVIDRYSLNSFKLMKFVALYTLAFKISSVLKLVIVDSVKMAISPLMIKKMHDNDNLRFYSKTMLYTSYVVMMGIVVVSLFSFELIKVMAKSNQFWQAYVIIPILCLSVFFVNIRDLTTNALFITKKTGKIGFIVLAASLINLGLNMTLIPLFGIIGAAMSTLLSQFIYYLITHYYSQREFYIPYENRKMYLLLVLGTIISMSSLLLNQYSLPVRMVVKGGLALSFPFILYLFNFYEKVELQAINGFVTKWKDLRRFGQNVQSLKRIADDM